MAELNEVVKDVAENLTEAAPQVMDASKEIVVKATNVLAERAKGFAAGATAAVVVLKGIPAAFKAVKGLITKNKKEDAIETNGEFVEEDQQEENFNEVEDVEEESKK